MTNSAVTRFTLRNEVLAVGDTNLELSYSDEAQARQGDERPGLYVLADVIAQTDMFDGIQPGLHHNAGIQADIRDWRELEGKWWDFPYDEKKYNDWADTAAGNFYAGEYTAIKSCRFEILKRDGRKFLIRWKGIADMFWGGDFDGDVPFDCVFEAELTGILIPQYVADQTEKGLRATLGSMINLDDFILVTNKFNGIKKFIFKGARYDNWE